MKPITGYEKAKIYIDQEKLPAGGQVIGILDSEVVTYKKDTPDEFSVLILKIDISEGDFKNYYTEQYKNSQLEDKKYKGNFRMNIPKGDGSEKDEWALRRLKTNIAAIEDSNPGFHWDWDEKKLKGKKVGMIFQDKEWEFNGKVGFTAMPYCLKSVENIRGGKFKLPAPKMLNGAASSSSASSAGFTEIEDDGDLPF